MVRIGQLTLVTDAVRTSHPLSGLRHRTVGTHFKGLRYATRSHEKKVSHAGDFYGLLPTVVG